MKISSSIPNDVSHLSERDIAAMLPDFLQPFTILFEKGELGVELFAPRGKTSRVTGRCKLHRYGQNAPGNWWIKLRCWLRAVNP